MRLPVLKKTKYLLWNKQLGITMFYSSEVGIKHTSFLFLTLFSAGADGTTWQLLMDKHFDVSECTV